MWANDAFAEAYSKLRSEKRITDELLLKLFEDEQVVGKLKEENIVVPENFDEISFVRKYQDIIRLEDTATNVEFIVTYACNLSCTYCYAIRKKVALTPEIAYAAADFAIDFAKSRQSNEMSVQFIGGEPLLNRHAIEIIVERMLGFKNANRIAMRTTLSTNGILLDKSVIDLIRKLGPIQVQITIDGPEEIHNSRRPLRGGNSYQIIMDNIVKYKQYIDELVIRINIDRDNIEHVPILLKQLTDNSLLDASLSIVPTFSHTDQCSHYHLHCFTTNELRPNIQQAWREALAIGFIPSWNPLPTFISCHAISPGSIAIDPYGDIYKCAAVYGDKIHAVGNIFKGLDTSPNSLYMSYIKRDALLLDRGECRLCASLPICAGGCAFRAEQRTGSMFAHDCRYDKKECLDDFVRLYADWYKKGGFTISPKVKLL
jgi:uncharacterized protein